MGNWVNGQVHGVGQILRTNNQTCHGEWNENVLSKMIDGDGNITENFKDVDGIMFMYKGKKSGGKREGYGTLFSSDGLIAYQGNFHNDKYEGEGR
jgi:hypothetical protein